jgi:glycosyltransferase involved in cell wall biosynthesis
MNKLIEKYNTGESILVISSYPEKNVLYSRKVCAVGGFTKNTLKALKKTKNNIKYVVLTLAIDGKREIYEENETLVIRCFNRNSLLSYILLIKEIFRFNKIKNALIEFEFGSWGNTKTTAMFLTIPLLLTVLAKKQTIILHQVISNLKDIQGHLGWKKKDLRNLFFDFFIKKYYKILVLLSNKVVVTEEIFKQRLLKIVDRKNKIITISHGVDTNQKLLNKDTCRKILKLPKNKNIILFFGYLSWYKGADLFVKYAKRIRDKRYYFVLAGGESFTNSGKKHYTNYLKNFKNLPKNILLTGFVPENKIKYYFGASDLVVLPYRAMMSSSGPLSLAFTFEKPILLSNKLSRYLISEDFKKNLKFSGVDKKDIFFSLNQKDFYNKLISSNLIKLHKFSKLMKKERSFINIAQKYSPLLLSPKKNIILYWDYLKAANEIYSK